MTIPLSLKTAVCGTVCASRSDISPDHAEKGCLDVDGFVPVSSFHFGLFAKSVNNFAEENKKQKEKWANYVI